MSKFPDLHVMGGELLIHMERKRCRWIRPAIERLHDELQAPFVDMGERGKCRPMKMQLLMEQYDDVRFYDDTPL